MLEVALINMPFASVQLPSLGLTQLKAVLTANLGERVEPKIFYLNHDFARFLGIEAYVSISNSMEALTAGLGDWFFRGIAFPDAPDTTMVYMRRYLMDPARQRAMQQFSLFEKHQKTDAALDEYIDRYQLEKYPVVGFTSLFQQNVACFAMARKLKERNPDVVTVMGGANCETPMGQVIARNVESIDFVFSGPALKTFPELLQYTLDGEEEKCHRIHGVISRKKLAQQNGDKPHEIGEELDVNSYIPLDYGEFLERIDGDYPVDTMPPSLLFETSRGCWWGERSQCTFCGLNGLTMNFRGMRPQKALELFEDLFKHAPGISRFEAVDNVMPREYLTEVLPHLRTPPGAGVFYEVRADLKDHEMATLAKAGIREVQPGIEALTTPTLKLMRKGTTVFQNIKFLKSCVRHNISPGWNLLVGFPGEGDDAYKGYVDNLPLLVHLPPPSGVYPIRFDRFSVYFRSPEEYGLKLKPLDFYKLIYPFDAEALDDLAYYFSDDNYAAPYLATMVKWIDRVRAQFEDWRTRWDRSARQLKPELRFETRDGNRVVYDSRTGKAVETEVGATGLRLLDLLVKPMKFARIVKNLEDVPEVDLQRQIATLKEQRFLFQEGELTMSLILEEGPPPSPVQAG
ncbi:MAG: RiPP maturation radical SAM protein 1 [bacterium]|nr:RiPP maturation radical SAM protein 1 [bacterium]